MWEELAEAIGAPVPTTPTVTVDAPSDEAATRLQAVEHIVVVMLKN